MAMTRSMANSGVASIVTTLSLLVLAAGPLHAQCDRGLQATCGRATCATPAKPAPASLWGALQPTDSVSTALPAERDTSNFNEFTTPYFSRNWFFSLDVENNWLLAGLAHGIGVWDARTTPEVPTFVAAKLYAPSAPGGMPFIPGGESSKIVFGSIDAPAGVDSVAAVAGYNGAGILVFDLTDKAAPRPIYQNSGKTSESVYAARIGSTNYAFLASQVPAGVYTYNLSQAMLNSPTSQTPGCLEDGTTTNCSGVRLGSFPNITSETPYYLHGVGNLVTVSFGSSRGFKVYDVSNPASPLLRAEALTGTPAGYPVYGVAMWQYAGQTYTAVRVGIKNLGGGNLSPEKVEIYNVSCALSGSCSPVLVGSLLASTGGQSQYLTASSDAGGKPYLYLGSDGTCGSTSASVVPAREILLDVSNPAAPFDISPSTTTPISALYEGVSVTRSVSYWSWYYREGPSGFNLVAPRVGKFNGDRFYRAARSIMDFHKKSTPSPPTANFSWAPSEIYPGTPVQFTDSSTAQPTSWAWTFQDGAPTSAFTQNPQVSFGSVGSKSVTLISTNGQGSSLPNTKNLTVLSPAPAIAAVSASPSSALVCQPITLSASGVTGQPTLGYAWQVLNSSLSPVFTSSQTAPTWSTVGMAPGSYSAQLTVTNTVSSAQASTAITLNSLPPLPISFTPTNDPFTSGTVQFHVVAAGATEWNWDFGDGSGYRGWTNDPVNGPNPINVYTSTGPRTVRVKVRNCIEAEKTSADLSITILQTTPLSAGFSLQTFCTGFGCFGNVNEAIGITDSSTGAQFWDYDWNGDGTYEDANNTAARATHTFSSTGTFSPKLKVRRGSGEQDVFTHMSITISAASPPSISVSGPSSGAVNAAHTFSATASNCTAAASGWSWNVGGGTGSSTSNTISITWSSTGSKSISATNSGCGSASGSSVISITSGGGGGTLGSVFSFSPAAPKAGEAVTFNGTASTGSPSGYEWNFGDGTPTVSGSSSTIAHAFAQPGTYNTRLSVTKSGTGPGCLFNVCVAESTKAVVVQSAEPPLTADIETSATCESSFVGVICSADAGVPLTFTAVAPGATSLQWNFGDGSQTASGSPVSHTFSAGGSFTVQLVATKGLQFASASRFFNIDARPKSVAVPWVAQNQSPNAQTSDLYVNNPSASPLPVSIYFRRRGTPVTTPPKVERTIPARGTLLFPDALGQLFTEPNNSGFIVVEVGPGLEAPVVTAVNTSVGPTGLKFTQTVRGVTIDSAAVEDAGDVQHLFGLSDTLDRDSYLGLTNIGDTRVDLRLEFFDRAGSLLATSSTIGVPRFGQKQITKGELRSLYNVQDESDYRVELNVLNEGDVVAFGASRQLATADPSFATGSSGRFGKLYLLGATDSVSNKAPVWQTDIVLANPAPVAQSAVLRFVEVGGAGRSSAPVTISLAAGETKRLVDAISANFNAAKRTGMVVVETQGADGIYPIALGETYDNFVPTKRYGQTLEAFAEAEAAGTGERMVLVGLRQDADHKATFWVAAPGDERASFDVVIRDFQGNVLKTMANQGIGAGKVKQYLSGSVPAAPDGLFTVEIVVRSGKVIAAGQVTTVSTNDPAFVKGQAY